MDPARERRALDAFDTAIGWTEDSRAARLAALLADDPGLIATVQGLLAAECDADLMPTRPPEPAAVAADTQAPERVGAYRTAELIGRGGMGSVYRGERIEGGFEQTVAIKLIRSGLFTAAAAEQFAQERQILARLHHPHITQLYDGGQTADGQAYIVMEMVQGEPILDHLRSRGLGLKERLRLFVEVCGAIDYAHGQGVVHADIKPSNIIVDPRSGVKLLDFGTSGLIGGAGPASGVRGSTPMFASPQQMAHAPASTADDIYALGVLLQVLVGDQSGFDGELAAVAARARASEPEGRYASAKDMSDDIERWSRIEPVCALPARRRRALWFFWRRNRLAVSLSVLATAGLVIAVVVMTGLYLRADAARRQSDQRFGEVRALSHYMISDLTGALAQFPGAGNLRAELARRGRSYLEGLSRIPDAPTDVRLEVSEGYAKTGDILTHLGSQNAGDPAAGRVDLARAESGLRKLMAQTGARDDVALALADVLASKGAVVNGADKQPKAAEALYSEACGLEERVISHDPRSVDAHLAHLRCLLGLAHVLYFEGRFVEELKRANAVVAEIRAMPPGADPTTLVLDEATALNDRGEAAYYLGDHAGTLQPFLDAAAVLDKARQGAPDVRVLDLLSYTTYNIASSLDDLGRKTEELAWIERGVAVADQIRTFEDTPHSRRAVAIVHSQHAASLAALGRFDEAITEERANIVQLSAFAAQSPHDYVTARSVPVDLRALGDIYWLAKRRKQACATFAETRQAWDRLAQTNGVLDTDRSSEMQSLKTDSAPCTELRFTK
jgi:serine/threonine-protein kinase